MSIFVEFAVPASAFPLEKTLNSLPDAVVEIERVAASEELLTPHFWVANVSAEEFEAATRLIPRFGISSSWIPSRRTHSTAPSGRNKSTQSFTRTFGLGR